MGLFDYLDKIVQFHEERQLPKDVYIYEKASCSYLRAHMKNLKGQNWPIPIFQHESLIEHLHYQGFTFYLVDIV